MWGSAVIHTLTLQYYKVDSLNLHNSHFGKITKANLKGNSSAMTFVPHTVVFVTPVKDISWSKKEILQVETIVEDKMLVMRIHYQTRWLQIRTISKHCFLTTRLLCVLCVCKSSLARQSFSSGHPHVQAAPHLTVQWSLCLLMSLLSPRVDLSTVATLWVTNTPSSCV